MLNGKQVKVGLVVIGVVLVGAFLLSDGGKSVLFDGADNDMALTTDSHKTLIVESESDSAYQAKCVSACQGLLPNNPVGDKDCSQFCPLSKPAACKSDCVSKCSNQPGFNCQGFCGALCGQIGVKEEQTASSGGKKWAESCQSELDEILKSNQKLLFKSLPKLARYFPVSADARVFLSDGTAVKLGNRRSVRGDGRAGMEQKFLSLNHKFANLEGDSPSVLMLFSDNTVVTANARPCEIESVYYPTEDGKINGAVVAHTKANMHVMADKCSEGGHGCGLFDGKCCSTSKYWRCSLKCGYTSVGQRCTCK